MSLQSRKSMPWRSISIGATALLLATFLLTDTGMHAVRTQISTLSSNLQASSNDSVGYDRVGYSSSRTYIKPSGDRAPLPDVPYDEQLAVLTDHLPIRENTTAWCVGGGMRGFAEPHVASSLRESLINSWSGEIENAIDDVLVYVSIAGNNGYTLSQLSAALSMVKPVQFHLLHDEDLVPVPNNCSWRPGKYGTEVAHLATVYWNIFRRMQVCYNHVTQRELAQGWKYEFVMRHRPDARWPTPLPFNIRTVTKERISILKNHPGWTSAPDFFAAVPRQFADVYFNAADVYYECLPEDTPWDEIHTWCTHWGQAIVSPNQIDGDFAPECYLRKWLQEHKVETEPFSYQEVTLYREDGTSVSHYFG